MSPDLERRLREARSALPEPDPSSTERARARALRRVGGRRRPRRRVAGLALAIVVTLGLGVAFGSFVAPSTTASDGPSGLGFLPLDGWYVLQAGTDATPERPAIAIASNVPLRTGDGRSIVPYETLLRLPEHGIVIVANFTGRAEEVTRFSPRGTHLVQPGNTRLVAGDATPIRFGGQVRHEEPLGQYELHGDVNGYSVDVHIYYGVPVPTLAHVEQAQLQLAQLVVRASKERKPAATTSPKAPAATVDRSYACTTLLSGGILEIEARAHSGVRESARRWKTLPFAVVATGSTGSAATQLDNSLVWITAGTPSATTIVEESLFPPTVVSKGTVAVNLARCRATSARIPLSAAGLRGGTAGQLGEQVDCETPRRILVRLRARLESGGLKRSSGFLRSTSPVTAASLAVRTQKGKPIVYATVAPSGVSKLFTAKGCVPD